MATLPHSESIHQTIHHSPYRSSHARFANPTQRSATCSWPSLASFELIFTALEVWPRICPARPELLGAPLKSIASAPHLGALALRLACLEQLFDRCVFNLTCLGWTYGLLEITKLIFGNFVSLMSI